MLPSSSVEEPDTVIHVARQSDPEYGIILNPVVWLVMLISIFSAVFVAMQYDVTGPEILDMLRRLLADL